MRNKSELRDNRLVSGWRGVALIAIVYVYFLIFAQFAFLTRMADLGIGGSALKVVMAAMAAGGILFSLLTPRTGLVQHPATCLRIGLAVSALAAVLSLLPLGVAAGAVVAFLIGGGLGITTVTLVTHLRTWTGKGLGIVQVGLGAGLAYFICNVPAVFTASPEDQAMLAACLCVIAIVLPLRAEDPAPALDSPEEKTPFPMALVSFAALIWLDSAAFYIIQHTPALKAGTWLGSVHLWTNGVLHLVTAVVASMLLQRGRTMITLALAFGSLAFACILLQHSSLILSASLFYPIGVSLYSVALVAYPSFLTSAGSTASRAKQAGWIYAIAGWIGSALGIGMGQNLGHVPLAFVVAAGTVVLAPMVVIVVKNRERELALIAAVGAIAFVLYKLAPEQRSSAALTSAERGRQVYISEGCISCHSQYVRPDSPDVLMWGPTETMEDLHRQKPPLIGNRRQGPDLSQVGLRRSRLWLKAHLVSPAEVSYRSPMPSYALLFADARGNDLVDYLSTLRGRDDQQLRREAAWSPAPEALENANADDGERLYQQNCATCHDAQGATRLHWLDSWNKTPQTLRELREYALHQKLPRLAQIAKFGMPGTDMPGHEYLNDRQIASVALFLKRAPVQDLSQTLTH
jgi:cbb3-type cytochrome oxidase cytochrome c subunit